MSNKDFFKKVGTNVTEQLQQPSEIGGSIPTINKKTPKHESTFLKPDDINETVDEAERRWAVSDNTFWIAKRTSKELPSGLYRCGLSPEVGAFLIQVRYDIDNLLVLPDSASNIVLAEIEKFWQIKNEFSERGFTHKRGVLLWGPPGSGKTSTVQLLIEMVVKRYKGVGVFIDNPIAAIECLQTLRRSEPSRPIIALLEDMDALIAKFGESEYLSLLDGENQIGNIVFVATTNYPERLDKRFVDRPSRFDTILEVDMPSTKDRQTYLLAKEPSLKENDEYKEWAKLTEGLSIAYLKELIILVKCYKHPLADAVERLLSMHDVNLTSSGRKVRAGFR